MYGIAYNIEINEGLAIAPGEGWAFTVSPLSGLVTWSAPNVPKDIRILVGAMLKLVDGRLK